MHVEARLELLSPETSTGLGEEGCTCVRVMVPNTPAQQKHLQGLRASNVWLLQCIPWRH